MLSALNVTLMFSPASLLQNVMLAFRRAVLKDEPRVSAQNTRLAFNLLLCQNARPAFHFNSQRLCQNATIAFHSLNARVAFNHKWISSNLNWEALTSMGSRLIHQTLMLPIRGTT